MTQKQKNAKTQKTEKKHYTNNKFFTKWKNTEREILAFCVITFEPIKIYDPEISLPLGSNLS